MPWPETPAAHCTAEEPDGPALALGSVDLPEPPWSGVDCGSLPDPQGPTWWAVDGALSSIVFGTWDGDRDAVSVVMPVGATVRAVLQWEPLQGDLDAMLWCSTDGGWTDLTDGALATAELPEDADGITIPDGATCWLFVAGYHGDVVQWTFWLEPA